VLTIGSKEGVLKIIDWLNGRLRTPKVAEFNEMIDWFNLHSNLDIKKKPIIDQTLENY